jgi:predicted transposase YbfD/YdcC
VGVIAIDGKTMRGTHDSSSGKKALHIVSAWFSETGMVLGQVKTSEKSNEITAIPQLLDILSIRGNIITIDAMGTQKEIAKKIVDKKGDYVLSLKGNQPTLLKEVELFFREVGSEKYREEYGIKHFRQIDNGHGRVECRDYYITDRIGWMDARKEWEKLTTIGVAVYSREEKGEKKKERRYFICSIKPDVERFAHAVRNHWGIESMHWSLDITFLEDSKRTRKDNGPENLSVLHKFAYNITRNDKGVKKSLKIKRLRASMSEKYLEKLLSGE